MAESDPCLPTGGYDVESFVDTPNPDLICTICHGVFRCPVRAPCHHIFCKKCILQWLNRQESCPCCRKPVNQNLIFVIFKMSKSIGRMKIKCRNEIRGCRATFPLSEKYSHGMSCPFELLDCQHPGCGAQLLRRDMEAHSLQCEYRQQPCHMGCGTLLSPRTQAQHSCYQQLRQEEEAKREQRRAVVATLKRKMRRLQNTMERVKRQIVLICESLEIMDDIEAVEGMGEMVELEEEGLESGDSNASSSTSRSSRSSSSTSS